MSVATARPRAAEAVDATTALLYRRVSTREQSEEGVSLGAQLDESRRYVVRQGWMLGDEYEDVESGRRDDRADYQRMLLTIRGHRLAGRRVVLVVAALDRLGRNLAERVRVWDELKRLGVPLYSVREGGLQSEFT
jgi:DNA invertase Pin-like site-specific DNA recombinase